MRSEASSVRPKGRGWRSPLQLSGGTASRGLNKGIQRRHRVTRGLFLASLTSAVFALLCTAIPAQLVGRVPVLVLLVAMQVAITCCLSVASAVLFAGALFVCIRHWRSAQGASLLMIIALLAVVACMTSSLAAAGNRRSEVRAPLRGTTASEAQAIRILSWNTDQDKVTQSDLIHLFDRVHADVIVLPEYFSVLAKTQLGEWARAHDMQILSWENSAASILISKRLGIYTVDSQKAPLWAGFVAEPSTKTSPRFIIAHLQQPGLSNTELWKKHLSWVARACNTPESIVVGDLNATLGNIGASNLGGCSDSASLLKIVSTATWPTSLPGALGATIDHVMIGRKWKPVRYTVVQRFDQSGSDHRPIMVDLRAH